MPEQNKSDEYLISVETFIKNGNFKDALFFCDKILQEDKQNAKAYFFKLLIKNEIRYAEELEKKALENGIAYKKKPDTGTEIGFGKYSWYIIDKNNDNFLLLAKENILDLPYNSENEEILWESCTVRKYLNNEFYKDFTEEEKERILPIINGNSEDRVYLLDSKQAQALSASVRNNKSWWWLRGDGQASKTAPVVMSSGSLYPDGALVTAQNGVRPAITIKAQNEPDEDYMHVLEYGDDPLKERLVELNNGTRYNYAENILKKAEEAEDFFRAEKIYTDMPDFRDCNEKAKLCRERGEAFLYEKAEKALKEAKTEEDFLYAAKCFSEAKPFKDSEAKEKECKKKAEEAKTDALYEKAREIIQKEYSTEDELKYAKELFESLDTWKDSKELAKVCDIKIEALKKRLEREIAELDRAVPTVAPSKRALAISGKTFAAAAIGAVVLIGGAFAIKGIVNGNKTKNSDISTSQGAALSVNGNQAGLPSLPKGEGGRSSDVSDAFSNSSASVVEMANESKEQSYQRAKQLYNEKKYDEAYALFDMVGDYSDTEKMKSDIDDKYTNAVDLYNKGSYLEAFNLFNSLGGYKDAKSFLENPLMIMNVSHTGDRVKFGNNEWFIISKDEKYCTLLSAQSVCDFFYSNEKTDVTWENSSIRKYLNDIYYYTFSEEDRNLICEVENDNSDSNNSHGLAGNNTKDRVYILSIKQAYAVNEAFLNINKKQWLRSLGSDEGCAAFIDENGVISTGGESVNSVMCVRPVIKVRLGKPLID